MICSGPAAYVRKKIEADRLANRFTGHDRGSADMLMQCASLAVVEC